MLVILKFLHVANASHENVKHALKRNDFPRKIPFITAVIEQGMSLPCSPC